MVYSIFNTIFVYYEEKFFFSVDKIYEFETQKAFYIGKLNAIQEAYECEKDMFTIVFVRITSRVIETVRS